MQSSIRQKFLGEVSVTWAAALPLVFAAVACGSDKRTDDSWVPDPEVTGGASAGGAAVGGDGAGGSFGLGGDSSEPAGASQAGGGQAATDPGYVLDAEGCGGPDAPVVSVVAPESAEDYASGSLVTDSTLMVECSASKGDGEGAGSVWATGIELSVTVGDEEPILAENIVPGDEPDTYSAVFDLSGYSNGELTVSCKAVDSEGHCSRDESTTFLDTGPRIEVLSPEPGDVLSTTFQVRYTVEEAPLGPDDDGAAVDRQEVWFAGVQVEDVERSGDTYLARVDLLDGDVFSVSIVGEQDIEVRAYNSRSPEVVAVATVPVLVDVEGPSIEILDPKTGDARGGSFDVDVRITDASALAENSVVVTLGDDELVMSETGIEGASHLYSRRLDVSGFDSDVREITLNVVATDLAGNTSTASVVIKLDTVKPLVALDPPWVMEVTQNSSGTICSEYFDPVGDDALADMQVVGTAAEIRARIEDRGNGGYGTGGTVTFVSGVNTEEVKLYISDDIDIPLLVDLDGDGVCDDINPDVEPGVDNPDAAVVLDYAAIQPAGAAFASDGAPEAPDSSDAYGETVTTCAAQPDAMPPPVLCSSFAGTRVIPDLRVADRVTPAIYAKPPVTAATCAGDAWDFQGSIDPGWACVAMRAEDKLANVGLSAPLRLCFTAGADGACDPYSVFEVASADVPSCTDGCVPPESFADDANNQWVLWR